MDLYTFSLIYIDLNLKSYGNINIDFRINQFLFIMMLVIVVASISINYNRWVIITTVKKLIRHGAVDEESAKTLSELGISSRGIKRALEKGGQLTRIVRRAGEYSMSYEEYVKLLRSKSYKEEKVDFNETRFHIRKDSLESAKIFSLKSDITVLNTALMCVLIFAIFMCFILLMPEILGIINNLLGGI